ncbi:DUF3427 domain-containing protein [Spirochaeta cellobiosiphila]|uniref:DUF3427 domain-containing protein n=1 Tax=Spirochaeta cellobiosiphila TaxID=504483 RepID=UPI0003FAF7B4|nr:DUF3427 domain-containing protein [Spirochaeta cellobiosiphila]
MSLFSCGTTYSKKDIYSLIKVPKNKQGGNWDTGYNKYNSDYYLFVNIDSSGRTGHDYNNYFVSPEILHWEAKSKTVFEQPQIQELITTKNVYIFCREKNTDPFVFHGLAIPFIVIKNSPVIIIWLLRCPDPKSSNILDKNFNEEVYNEGAIKRILSKTIERNKKAREECIKEYGYKCAVCGQSMENVYGEIASKIIHIHHLKEITSFTGIHNIDPKKDLRPVCPNCHAVLHIKKPCLSIEVLKKIYEENNN